MLSATTLRINTWAVSLLLQIMPYSTGCTTPLPSAEAGLNYKDVLDSAIHITQPASLVTMMLLDPYAQCSDAKSGSATTLHICSRHCWPVVAGDALLNRLHNATVQL